MLSWINVTYVAKAQRRINRIKIVMRTEAHSKTNEAKVTDFKPDPAIRKREIILHTKMLPQKQKKLQFFSHKAKLALIEVLLKQDSYTFKGFLYQAISAVPNTGRNHTVKEIVTALFSSKYSNYLQFLYNEKERRIFLKPSWKGKTPTEVLNSTYKRSSPLEQKENTD